jgi:hypothetical protein
MVYYNSLQACCGLLFQRLDVRVLSSSGAVLLLQQQHLQPDAASHLNVASLQVREQPSSQAGHAGLILRLLHYPRQDEARATPATPASRHTSRSSRFPGFLQRYEQPFNLTCSQATRALHP